MDALTIAVALSAVLIGTFGFAAGSELVKIWRGQQYTYRLTISKPDEDRVLATAEMTGYDETMLERVIFPLTNGTFDIAIDRLEKEHAN